MLANNRKPSITDGNNFFLHCYCGVQLHYKAMYGLSFGLKDYDLKIFRPSIDLQYTIAYEMLNRHPELILISIIVVC